ncbi:sulfotransferase family protein [Novosphingobium sp. JCM 18896]|uniref:sulfotransferase family protein n=1 Tax=Novosphingobium sp. JCM 18896 TaxID=2989731 RepID=UPI002221FF12|nr:sulfotransferase [Novosphingobium sp. JCM 18896]MCW1428669.1 sulfotransferase [Novosphingobium sp. JCM 18896]
MDLTYDPPAQFRHAADQLHELVAREVGSDDFGPADYLPGLKVFLQSMDYDPRFTEHGHRAAWGQVVHVLKGRAHAVKAMKANPGFDTKPIVSPVVITGVPRTGTTALHRLMAVDPRFQGLQTWLLDSPMPRPPLDTWASYPEFQKSMAVIEARYAAAPQKRAAHHIAAEEVHECCMLLYQSFNSNILSCSWSSATYDAWQRHQDERAAYDYYYKCVQLIGMNDPDKRWLLKNPGHIENLDLLFAVYPDAKVIQTHRDPAKAIPSLVSLLMNLHPIYEEGRYDQRAENMLVREVDVWSDAVRRCDKVREQHPGQVLDVVHADFHRDPMGVLERIYAFIDMDIPDDTRAAMAQRIEEKPELARGAHRYSIKDYGMTEEQAREPFGDYVQRFDLLEKKA